MTYKIIISKSAQKEIEKLPTILFSKINEAILALAIKPRPAGCKKLKGFKDLYRIRVGDFRIVYSIQDKILTVEILRIADRKDVYK